MAEKVRKKGTPGPFRKGFDPGRNLKGRPKGSGNKFSIATFAKAIKSVEHDKKQQFMIAWLESAWGDASSMSEIMNYMLPKLRSIEGLFTTFENSMSDDIAKVIQKKLQERYSDEK